MPSSPLPAAPSTPPLHHHDASYRRRTPTAYCHRRTAHHYYGRHPCAASLHLSSPPVLSHTTVAAVRASPHCRRRFLSQTDPGIQKTREPLRDPRSGSVATAPPPSATAVCCFADRHRKPKTRVQPRVIRTSGTHCIAHPSSRSSVSESTTRATPRTRQAHNAARVSDSGGGRTGRGCRSAAPSGACSKTLGSPASLWEMCCDRHPSGKTNGTLRWEAGTVLVMAWRQREPEVAVRLGRRSKR